MDLYLQAMWEAVTFEFALKLGIIYFFIIWIALVVWVIKDISIRTNNLFFQIIAVLTILLLSPFGIFIYLLIRPRRTLYDKYYEEIEENLDIFNEIVEERKKEAEKKVLKNTDSPKIEIKDTNFKKENIKKENKLEEKHLDEEKKEEDEDDEA